MKNQYRETLDSLQTTIFIQGLENYFKKHMSTDASVDSSTQLSIMNFASEETGNLSVIQATLLAAFIGGIIGVIATFII